MAAITLLGIGQQDRLDLVYRIEKIANHDNPAVPPKLFDRRHASPGDAFKGEFGRHTRQHGTAPGRPLPRAEARNSFAATDKQRCDRQSDYRGAFGLGG